MSVLIGLKHLPINNTLRNYDNVVKSVKKTYRKASCKETLTQ